MRVALITEGTYPYRTGGLSTWCHQLVTGLRQSDHHVVALTGTSEDSQLAYPLPAYLTGVTTMPIWDPPPARHRVTRRGRRAATNAAVLLCRGMLGDAPHHATMFREGLRRLAHLRDPSSDPLREIPLADVLADAWRAARAGGVERAGEVGGGEASTDFRVALPRLSLREAESAATLLAHALRPLALPVPPADLCHPTSGGLPLLVALATRWRAGTPYLLTEHGIYLRERFLDYGQAVPEAVKAVMLRFFRALSQLGYTEAALVVAGSRFVQRWQLRHGAQPARVVVVTGGVDPADCPPELAEPAEPVVVWLGRVEPLKDLGTLIRALRQVRLDLPEARLRVSGPTADETYQGSCEALVERLGLTHAVEFTGRVDHPVDAYAAGQVVARCNVSEGTPYPVLEAMMCGRATVATAVGGVEELVGDAGLVVPPGEPAELGAALLSLLRSPERRRRLGAAARRRALEYFTLGPMLRAYDQLYLDVRAQAGVRVG